MTYSAQIEAICETEAGLATAYFQTSGRSVRAALTSIADQIEVDFGAAKPASVTIILSRISDAPA